MAVLKTEFTGCRQCFPAAFPDAAHQPRQSNGHVSTRFADEQRRPFFYVVFNGVVVQKAVEAMAGEAGWVIDETQEFCFRHHRPLERVRYGSVIVASSWAVKVSE